MGETHAGSVSFLFIICSLFYSTFKLYHCCSGRFSFHSTLFIHSPCQTGSQPMSGQYYILMFTNVCTSIIRIILIEYNVSHLLYWDIFFIAPLIVLGITGFCLTIVYRASLCGYICLHA